MRSLWEWRSAIQLCCHINPYNVFVTDAVTIHVHVCEIEFFMEFRACILGSSIIIMPIS